MRRVVRQLGVGQQRGQKKVAPRAFVQQQRVLANPTKPGEDRKFSLQQRRRIDDAAAFGAAAQPPTLVLHTGVFAARRLAALRCHRTQVAGGPFDQVAAAEAEALLGVEHYRRADVGSTAPAFIERLAAPSLETL